MVITLALSPLENVGDNREPLVLGGDLLQVRIDFLLGRALADLDAGRVALLLVLLSVVGNEGLAGLVGVHLARLLAVGLSYLVLRRAGLNAEQVVEGDILAFGLCNLVAEPEDFVVYVRC